jgi:hypothetical protein
MSTVAPTEFQDSRRSSRTREEIWSLISNPATWPDWNGAVAELRLDGPFATGTTGRLTPPGGNPLPFRLVHVTPGVTYTSETTIASTVTLRSTTALSVDEEGAVVHQHSELVGPAAEHFAPAFGDALVAGVSRTVGRLAGRVA